MPSSITVQASATAPAMPDEVGLSVEVSFLDKTPHDALAEVARRSETIEALLAELGIEPRRWTTSGAVVNEQVDWHRQSGERIHRGYLASNSVTLRLEDPALIGKLMQEATRRAQARVNGPWWTIAPDNPARLQACADAAAMARRKAEAYASALGARLGAVLGVTEPGISHEPRQAMAKGRALYAMAAESAPPEVDVHAGELDVSASVIVEFALEEG